jgi:hypothetical protein
MTGTDVGVTKDGKLTALYVFIEQRLQHLPYHLGQEEGGVSMAAVPKINFQHPVDLGDLTQVNCSDCHTGGVGP